MTVTAHVADRSGFCGRFICILLAAIACVSITLYVSGTFVLMSDVVGILYSSNTNLRTASGVAKFCDDLRLLSSNQLPQVILLITTLYLLLQTFCVPGTIVLNAATGAILGTLAGVLYCTLLGTVGASCCYVLSSIVGVALVEGFDSRLMKGRGLIRMRTQINKFRKDLFVYLVFLRLTPILPNWIVNLASPVVGVPLYLFATATFLGIIPQTYLAVRFGAFAHVSSKGHNSIVSIWDTLLLAVLGAAVLFVFFLKKKFSATNTHQSQAHSTLVV